MLTFPIIIQYYRERVGQRLSLANDTKIAVCYLTSR